MGDIQTPDPLLYDMERLQGVASEGLVRRGLACFKDQRVLEIGWEPGHVWAAVESDEQEAPHEVDISTGEDGGACFRCTCEQEDEPVCPHTVATLLAYAARQEVTDEQVQGAQAEAVADRRRRGRIEVVVDHVGGDPLFGSYEARSLNATGVGGTRYRVELRSLSERINHCSCPDFATNRLGTCKHIEAVVHTAAKRRGRRRAEPGASVVYLAWDVPDAPRVRLRPAAAVDERLAGVLSNHFDNAGFLRGSLPDAFVALRQALQGHARVHVGADVEGYALQVAADQGHRVRAARVEAEIRGHGGQLPGVRARLYPYQVEGVAFLAATGRAVLADDMGLGKTLQAIAASSWLMRNEGVARTLVVCPASLKHQWAREIERFTGAETEIVQGNVLARRALYRRRAPYSIINYELVLRDHASIVRELAPDLLVLDEAQRIKNWRTKTADAIKRVRSRYAFVLTGTPLENRLEDLYSVLQVVDPRVLGPLWHFLLEFHISDERGRVIGYRNLSELRRRLAPVMLRRDRAVVRDQLPDRVVQRLDVDLSARQADLHDAGMQAASMLARIAKRRPLTPTETNRLMAALQQARMACDAAGLVDGETEGSPKLDELRRLLEDLCLDGGRKVVVFSQWEKMTVMAAAVAEELGLGVARLHGGVPTAKRGALIERFRDDPGVQVFLSTDAGGVGLNLQCASVLINLDIPWNPAVLEQRIGRIHRIGQRDTALVQLLVARGAYEERVLKILESKRTLFTNVVDADAHEDVVGVSKRSLEVALEALEQMAPDNAGVPDPEPEPGDGDAQDAAAPEEEDREAEDPLGGSAAGLAAGAGQGGDLQDAQSETPTDGTGGPETQDVARDLEKPVPDDEAAALIAALQTHLGSRLERIVATRGGLLAVVDVAEPGDAALGEEVSRRGLEVAVVDRATYAALSRLGFVSGAGPGSGSSERYVRAAPAETRPHPLATLARRKLEAAETLHAAGAFEESLGLLGAAMAAAAALAGGEDELVAPETLPVWLYTGPVPSGALSAEQAGQILRATALAAAPQVPESLVSEVLYQARALVLGGPAASADA